MGRLFVTGDTHQYIDIDKLYDFRIEEELTKDDILIILGDAGLVFNNDSEREKRWRKWFNDRNFTTVCVRGNHDNPIAIRQYPIVNRYGGELYQIEDSVFYVQDSAVYDFNGHICLCVNGADSIDMYERKEGINWWREERITQKQVDIAIENALCYSRPINFVLSHTGGSEVCRNLGFKPTISDLMLDKVLNTVDYSKHFCGHYHKDVYINHNERVVFDDIIEVR